MRHLATICVLVLSATFVAAQTQLPMAPSATQQQVQQQRFLEQVDVPPQSTHRLTAGDKFQLFLQQGTSPLTFSAAAVSAGVAQATHTDPAFCCGWNGYTHRYGLALADSESNAFFAKFLIPMLAHQDPRYQRNGREAFFPRVLDALSQVIDTTTDDGEPQFNYSQVLGTVVSDSIANAYYPPGERGLRHTGIKIVRTLGADGGMNIVREFLPDIKAKLFGSRINEREREALTWRTSGQMTVTPAPRPGALTRR
jgi:hypothetical protein